MNGSGLKATSLQAQERKPSSQLLRVQASSPSLQAQESGNPDKVGRAQAPGYRQQGQRYFFYA